MVDSLEQNPAFTSPYKTTTIIIQGGRASYGIWQPLDVALEGDEELFAIQEGMEGTLEFVADIVYGDRALWRVIANANQIDFCPRDVVPGMRVVIPKPALVKAALQARANQAASRGSA